MPAEAVWALVQQPATFQWVAWPLLAARGPMPARWEQGCIVELRLLGLGVLPLWRQQIEIVELDHGRRILATEEKAVVFRRWRHRISVAPEGAAECRYADELELDAGALTPVGALVVRAFFGWRQRRWRTLA